MPAELFWDLVARFGLPLALVALALWTGRAGNVWRWSRECTAMEQAYERRLADMEAGYEKRLFELRAEMEARLLEVRARLADSATDRDFYRTGLFEALNKADKSLDVSARAVNILEKAR